MWDLINLKHYRYCPWDADFIFSSYYNIVSECTLVDKIRCYELWSLVEQSSKLNEGCLIEIGVWRGGTGAIISKSANLNGIKNNIYLCDGFSGVVKSTEKDSSYRGGEHSDTNFNIVESLLKKIKAKNTKILNGIFPDETSKYLEDDKIRFCHIDVDTYQSAKEIFKFIWDKMVIGGIVVYDDYGFRACDGITKHVNEMIKDNDKIVMYNLNGHAIIIKR